jgi:copper chaperone
MKNTYSIKGMTCSGCVRTVETILKNQSGVSEVFVRLEPGEAEISFDESTTSAEKLATAIGKMGYEMAV